MAEAVARHGRADIGPRFGVFAGWWSQRNATVVNPGLEPLLRATAAATSS